jgi:hypothetical protein
MLRLVPRRCNVLLVFGSPFFCSWLMLNAARTAAVGHMVVIHNRVSLHNRPVNIRGVNDCFIHMDNGRVVSKRAAAPFSAGEPNTHVTEAVIHAAIVPHVRTPIAIIERVHSVIPAPVSRRPKCAGAGTHAPGTQK